MLRLFSLIPVLAIRQGIYTTSTVPSRLSLQLILRFILIPCSRCAEDRHEFGRAFETKATSYTQVYIYTLLAVELPGTRLKLSRSLLGDYKSRKQPFPQLYLISSTLSSAASLDNGALEASTTQSSEPAAAGIYTP